jgi:hypothetical protein
MGRLALIADELGQAATAAAVRGRMKAALAPWLAGANANPLRHDGVWGGTCSAAGLADGGDLVLFLPDLGEIASQLEIGPDTRVELPMSQPRLQIQMSTCKGSAVWLIRAHRWIMVARC